MLEQIGGRKGLALFLFGNVGSYFGSRFIFDLLRSKKEIQKLKDDLKAKRDALVLECIN